MYTTTSGCAGGGGGSGPPGVMFPGDIVRSSPAGNPFNDQYAVKDVDGTTRYFPSLLAAEEYSRNMMMAGITHYPEKVNHRYYIEHHGDYYIYDCHVNRNRGVSDSLWVRCLPKAAAYAELERLNRLPHALEGAIRASKKVYRGGTKWIVADTNRGKDIVFDRWDDARVYVDTQNKIAASMHAKANHHTLPDSPKTRVVKESGGLAPDYYVKRDNGKWCIFDRNTKHFGYDTKVYIDPKTKRLNARNYMEARRVCQQLNCTQKRTGVTYCYEPNTGQYVVTVDGQYESAWTSEALAKYRCKDVRSKRSSKTQPTVDDLTAFTDAVEYEKISSSIAHINSSMYVG